VNESKKKNEATPTDRLQRDAYRRRISDKNNWFEKADDFLHGASFLKPEVEKIYGVWENQLGISSELPLSAQMSSQLSASQPFQSFKPVRIGDLRHTKPATRSAGKTRQFLQNPVGYDHIG
jgi:hypothetical protein